MCLVPFFEQKEEDRNEMLWSAGVLGLFGLMNSMPTPAAKHGLLQRLWGRKDSFNFEVTAATRMKHHRTPDTSWVWRKEGD